MPASDFARARICRPTCDPPHTWQGRSPGKQDTLWFTTMPGVQSLPIYPSTIWNTRLFQ